MIAALPLFTAGYACAGSLLCTDQFCIRYMVGPRGKDEASTASNNVGFRCVKPANPTN